MIRDRAYAAVKRLKADGIRCVLLTGDNRKVARRVADALGKDEVRAEVLPDEKARVVREIREQAGVVAMVGDGINDAPALAEADIGIEIGAGTDVAIEAADVILVRDDPADVPSVIALTKTVYRKMLQNRIWATGYNVIAIPLAAGGRGLLGPGAESGRRCGPDVPVHRDRGGQRPADEGAGRRAVPGLTEVTEPCPINWRFKSRSMSAFAASPRS